MVSIGLVDEHELMIDEPLQIRIHATDGTRRTVVQEDPLLIHRTLQELDPVALFSQNKIALADQDSEVSFLAAAVMRIDLLTSRLSVWDYPFVLGALVELAEPEFLEFIREPGRREPVDAAGGTPVFLKLEMLHGQRVFLWMRVIAGLPAACWQRIYSLFEAPRLIFDLRAAGIGVLNLSHLLHYSIYPDPVELAGGDGAAARAIERARLRLASTAAAFRVPVTAR